MAAALGYTEESDAVPTAVPGFVEPGVGRSSSSQWRHSHWRSSPEARAGRHEFDCQSSEKQAPDCACPSPPVPPPGIPAGWAGCREDRRYEERSTSDGDSGVGDIGDSSSVGSSGRRSTARTDPIPCTAGGKRPQESDFNHCSTPQAFIRCGPHHRVELNVLNKDDVEALHDIWWRYRDDLTWPSYEKKPEFTDEDYNTFLDIAQKVVNKMVEEYQQPMVLDQATISNTNHIGHPPHADNIQFDSVWWKGKKIRSEDEVIAAQEGAYVLWRPEKTSYRSYSCSISLSDPSDFEGGEVQFFAKFGDKDPIASYKCGEGQGVAFCGCQRNIHAVTGVRSGFRLVLLVWTRPPNVRVPESQTQTCYFRPGTGKGVWLTTADMLKQQARKRGREPLQAWVPKDDDDDDCECEKCVMERKKLAWKDRFTVARRGKDGERSKASSSPTPTTSAGNSPRTGSEPLASLHAEQPAYGELQQSRDSSQCEGDVPISALSEHSLHCPHRQGIIRCRTHERRELDNVLTAQEIRDLHLLWKCHRDDLTNPWYDKKPEFENSQFYTFKRCAQKVVDAMAEFYGEPLVLDQATVSCTNHLGHPPHADNVQFDSVWWRGHKVRTKDELVAVRGGAEALFRDVKTNYRNYGASVALTNPWQYGGGDLEFYDEWGQVEPCQKYRPSQGSGVACCGCQKSIHAVTGVKWGFRLVLLVWTRSPDVYVPTDQKHVCFFRPGTGQSVWLTSADLERYPVGKAQRFGGDLDEDAQRFAKSQRRAEAQDSWGDAGSYAEEEPFEEDGEDEAFGVAGEEQGGCDEEEEEEEEAEDQ